MSGRRILPAWPSRTGDACTADLVEWRMRAMVVEGSRVEVVWDAGRMADSAHQRRAHLMSAFPRDPRDLSLSCFRRQCGMM